MKNNLYIDLHILQTIPPACVNRDDTGSPKTAMFGGARRARVSSQAWKRAMRVMFAETLDEADLAERTKRVVEKMAEHIVAKAQGAMEQEAALALATKAVKAVEIKTEANKARNDVEEAKALFFMSNAQADALAALLVANPDASKKELKEVFKAGHGIEIALFGRMVADDPDLNVDACAQVAHALSTHRAEIEFDYFTAVDDRQTNEESGAGMIGTVEFNASTLYRYATVAAHNLQDNLGSPDATARAVTEFVRAFALSMPTGKQNTFANRTQPYALAVMVRRDQPINLVGAFEKPISAGTPGQEQGFAGRSAAALAEYAAGQYNAFAGAPAKTLICCPGNELDGLGERMTFPALLEALQADLLAQLKAGDGA